ncbi:DedA family protein [Sulfurimonas sp.]
MIITTFLIEHFSYFILFIWSVLEGEIGLCLAGYLAKEGTFDFEKIVIVASAGALIGDVIVYTLGRYLNNKRTFLLKHYESRLKNIEKWFHKNALLVILFERFIYGTHIPSLLFIGMSGYSFWKKCSGYYYSFTKTFIYTFFSDIFWCNNFYSK